MKKHLNKSFAIGAVAVAVTEVIGYGLYRGFKIIRNRKEIKTKNQQETKPSTFSPQDRVA